MFGLPNLLLKDVANVKFHLQQMELQTPLSPAHMVFEIKSLILKWKFFNTNLKHYISFLINIP
jgi:hypothetical protein